ncbi:MAG: HNH endonuclease [Bdellovibrionales bacterium]|nr:HNH endonuclease [Bdellovibrionales bacterium]
MRFNKLVQTERKITHLVLECIAEIDTRRLYLEKAYPSLYEFLVKEFGYSPSAAVRRIESARLLREVPEVAVKIESGAINLSQLSKVQQAVRVVQKTQERKMDTQEKTELIALIENTTQEQTQVILNQKLSIPITTVCKQRHHADESVTLTIHLTKEQMEILTHARNLISHAVPDKNWSQVFSYLAQKEITRRTALRKRAPAQCVLKADSTTATVVGKPLTQAVKKSVFARQACCQFRDPSSGKVCGSKRFLQVDHRRPQWAGGSNDLSNLQVLCAQHNQYKYRRESFCSYS